MTSAEYSSDGGEPRLSVVMPVHNGEATIRDQFEALVAAHPPPVPFEVIISDNGSTDRTAEIAREYEGRLPLRIVDSGRAPGINVARNSGVGASMGEWVILCDCDDEVDADWLVAMTGAFESGAQLVGGPIDYRRLNPPEVRAWRGADVGSVMTVFGYLPFAHGANCGFTRAAFEAIGGFDERFRYGGEDIEFFWRAQEAGFELVEVPSAIVHYRLRTSIKNLWSQSLSYGAAEVHLYRYFGTKGMQRRKLKELPKTGLWLITRAPRLAGRGRRGAWVRVLGQQIGRLRGAFRYRTPYL